MSKTLENMTHEELILKIKHLESKEQDWKSREQYLQFRIDQLNRLLFGAKRERFISNEQIEGQMELPFEVEEKPVDEEKVEQITYTRKKKQRQNHPGRTPLPDHLPVEEIILEPEEDTTGLKCIGKEVTDKLELVPAKLFIKRYIRPKYIKPEDDQNLDCKGIIAELPVIPIEKGIAGAGLLAQIMVDKDVKGKCHQGYIQSDGYGVYDWFGKKKNYVLLLLWNLQEKQYQSFRLAERCTGKNPGTQRQQSRYISKIIPLLEIIQDLLGRRDTKNSLY